MSEPGIPFTIRFWTKKLDDIHIEIVPRPHNEPAGLCGKPLLGNDYYQGGKWKNIDSSIGTDRKICVACALELEKRLDDQRAKYQENQQYLNGNTERQETDDE